MPVTLQNPFRGAGLPGLTEFPRSSSQVVGALLALCPVYERTPLIDAAAVAADLGIAGLQIKDERQRMGLGSFKALGAAFVIAHDASEVVRGDAWEQALRGRTYVAASAGNHGLSVAAGARIFGAQAVIYLAETVPDAFARRLRDMGAQVVRAGANYEASMEAAAQAADANDWTLLSDSSWPGYIEVPTRVMEGYVQLAAEIVAQMVTPPSHILLQAGVGGLAAAVAVKARAAWGEAPKIIVVEPDQAPALADSIRAGALVETQGGVSNMGRLDCKTPSLVALAGLARDADYFVTISDAEAERGVAVMAQQGFASTPSGAAGLAALIAGLPEIGPEAQVLAILSEGPEDA
ncbi:pyridoxal-phosphate dependent enzyme [Pararhodobacter oceanensis]|uniref:pyridoxal-phosphate dependent enzyme n=1 Tax=Pararhodobacter oceanensis TaxID=2172121 RepID=UPI003A947DBC